MTDSYTTEDFDGVFPPDEVEPPDPTVGQEGREVPPQEPTAEDPPVQDEPETYTIGDVELTREQALGLAEFYRWGQQNPEHLRAFDAYLAGQADFVPKGAEPVEPEPVVEDDLDWDDMDPALAKRLRRVEELERAYGELAQAQQGQQLATAQAVIKRAGENFAERYDLADEDLNRVMQTTAQLGILPGIANQTGDSIAAVEEALETAYWRTPELRQREIERRVSAASSEETRRRKASALSGSSGSIPRSQPTDDDPRTQMVTEIREAMREGTIPSA